MKRPLFRAMIWIIPSCCSALFAELPTNNTPQRQIRFADAEEANERRVKLIRFIWPDGLPTTCQPRVTRDVGDVALGEHLKGVDPSLAKRVDRLEVSVFGMRSRAYLMDPENKSNPPRLAVVHAGHSPRGHYLKADYWNSIHLFLRRGYSVVMMHMPQRGWNDDMTAVLTNGKEITTRDHADIVNLPQGDSTLNQGAGFRPFLEPVIACVNHWVRTNQVAGPQVTMIGLSGGGWTTHMAAALDTRIRLSFPVAGSYPLYLRNMDRGSVGDLEQYFSPLYDENISPDGSGGGAATWLEIYALGGFGEGRRQVMVTARHDSCCFRGDPDATVNTFKDVVTESVKTLGEGRWEHRLDATHRSHMISPWILDDVVAPIAPR